MAQSVPGGKSFLSRRSEPAVSFNRISQQKVRSTMSKLRTIGSGAGFDVSQSSGHILWRFCRLSPPSSPLSLWELIKHWTAWGQALAQSEKEKDLFYYPILTVRWISHFIGVCEKRLKDFSFRKFNYFLLFTCQLTFYLLPSRTLNSDTSTPFGGHTSPDTSNTSQCMNNWIFDYFLLS